MIRNEIKYIITPYKKEVLLSGIKHLCDIDKNSMPNGSYGVSSLYFDDYLNSAYEDKLNGVKYRKKFRIRIYNDDNMLINLERKVKKYNQYEKNSFQITFNEYTDILKGNIEFLKVSRAEIANDLYFEYKLKRIRPKTIVSYQREAYMYKYGNVRITFDSNLKTSFGKTDLFNKNLKIAATNNKFIVLELKYTGYLPNNIKALIQGINSSQEAFSKYVSCRII